MAVAELATPFVWQPGEHLACAGQTGSGKSFLMSALTGTRQYLVVLRSKPDDIRYPNTQIVDVAAKVRSLQGDRWVIRPKYDKMREQFAIALDVTYRDGGWTVYADERFFLEQALGLTPLLERLETQGRSKKLTLVSGMQRPSRVSRFALSEATHVLAFRLEGRDEKVMEESGSRLFADTVGELGRYEFAWLYRPTREVWRGKFDAGSGQLVGAMVG